MLVDSLILKVPLLFIAMYCCHVSSKPPNPPASEEERVRFTARGGVRDASATMVGTPLPFIFRRALYTINFVEVLTILSSILFPSNGTREEYAPEGPGQNAYNLRISLSFLLGFTLMCAGASIRATSFRHLGRYFTFELSVKKEHKLITDGPYSIVRHPAYTGSVLFYSGACLSQLFCHGCLFMEAGMWGNLGGKIFAVAYISYSAVLCYSLVSRAPKEDKVLQEEFKEEWTSWSKRTPYRLVPFVY